MSGRMATEAHTVMELHFCNVCGVSVPNAVVDDGTGRDAAGRVICEDHRKPAVDVPAKASEAGAGDEEPELLFCANCRISVPVTDVRSGRARREYGSLLCSVCTKADPGERAARREAVEAEMAADVETEEPVTSLRCNVCSAVVPQSHVVTGKALSEGDRVTCQSCRAVAASAPRAGGGFLRTAALFLVVAVVAGAVGYGVGPLLKDRMGGTRPDPLAGRVAALESSLDRRFSELAARIPSDDRAARESELITRFDDVRDDLEAQIEGVRAEFAGVRTELARADAAMEARLARIEGRLDEMSERVRDVAARPAPETGGGGPRPPPETGADPEPPDGGGMGGGDAPVVPEVNPEVARLCKALLESGEDSVRFPAANDLGRMGDTAAIPALAWALINDKHFLVRRACARSLSGLKAWNAAPYLIDALEDKEAYVAQQAAYALKEITGQDFDVTQDQSIAERRRKAKTARKWWEKNKDDPAEGVSLAGAELVRD